MSLAVFVFFTLLTTAKHTEREESELQRSTEREESEPQTTAKHTTREESEPQTTTKHSERGVRTTDYN